MTDYFEHIGEYKKGVLTGEALQAFESELKINAELQNAVDNHDVVEELFDLMWEDEIRRVMVEGGEVQNTEDNKSEDVKVEDVKSEYKLPTSRKWLKIAASLLALVAVTFLLTQQLNVLSSEELYAKHYSPFIESNITRGAEGVPVNLTPCKLGHYYLDEGQFEKAKQIFENDLKDQESDCHERSEWYLALYYLKNENTAQRDKLLEGILKNSSHAYYQKALKLQADLD